jgi:hypothetical protein
MSVDQVVFPPLDRSAGRLPSLISSYNGFKPSSQIDADVMQMGCYAVYSIDMLENLSAFYWILWTIKHNI